MCYLARDEAIETNHDKQNYNYYQHLQIIKMPKYSMGHYKLLLWIYKSGHNAILFVN